MTQLVKKIIILKNYSIFGYEKFVYEFRTEQFHQYSFALTTSFLPDEGDLMYKEWRYIEKPLFNIKNFAKICETASTHTILYLVLDEYEYLEHIVTEPRILPTDIFIESNENKLIYEFYTYIRISNLVIKVLKGNDSGERYNRIKLNKNNLSVRESIILDAFKEPAILGFNKKYNDEITEEDLFSLGRKSQKGFLKRICKLGSVWFIDFGANFGMFDDNLGIKYLYYIITHPEKDISLAELYCAINGGNQEVLQSIFNVSSKKDEDDFDKIRKTISSYEKVLKEINKKLKQKGSIEIYPLKKYQNDKVFIEKEIKRLKDVMHFGPKASSIEQERVRVSISKCISNAYIAFEKQNLHNAVKYFKKNIKVQKGYTYHPEDSSNPWILTP